VRAAGFVRSSAAEVLFFRIIVMKCIVYRSERKEGYYLYVECGTRISDLPAELTGKLGTLKQIMMLDLDRKICLQQVSAEKLREVLAGQHYYLFIQSPEVIEKIITEKLLKLKN
jgi:uncharacterized protein YcgL (UPF0745 family)